MTDLVSVGVPVYNGASVLRRALDSILAQTHENLEVVICDNASLDATQDIALEYARGDRRVKYYRNEANLGVVGNFRRVLELSSGQYFTWAAADDARPPTAFASCLHELRLRPSAVMAHGDVLLELEDRERVVAIENKIDTSGLGTFARIRRLNHGIMHNAMFYGLYRRDALQRIVFGAHYGQDYLFCLQVCLLGQVVQTKQPMIIYRERKRSPSDVMYDDAPLTLRNLLRVPPIRRKKCWTVLLRGSQYLARLNGPSLPDRIGAIAGHWISFVGRFRNRLVKETIYQILRPFPLLVRLPWRALRRLMPTARARH